MPEAAEGVGRTATFRGFLAIGVGWMLGLVAYDRLIDFMLGRAWLVQSEALAPEPFDPVLLAAGLALGALVAVADVRARRQPSRTIGISRFLVAAGVSMAGIGLFHAHAITALRVPGPDQVFLKDVLYHAPGIALIVAGYYIRPVRELSGRARTST